MIKVNFLYPLEITEDGLTHEAMFHYVDKIDVKYGCLVVAGKNLDLSVVKNIETAEQVVSIGRIQDKSQVLKVVQ